MTICQAEKICGYRIERLSEVGARTAEFAAYADEGPEIARSHSRITETVALKMLIEKLYGIEGDRIYEAQHGHCNDCHRFLEPKAMHRHHIIPRSKGRIDRGNLVGLCFSCHKARHAVNQL